MAVPQIIAIDGPAGSGKSTLGRMLADHFGYLYFDTGVMYRAVTLAALQRQVPIEDESAVTSLAEQVQIDVRVASIEDGRSSDVWLDGIDVTWEIRRLEVEAQVSIVSAYPGVRRALTGKQRNIGLRGRVVMVGRDIGTVVLPEADLKAFLDASVEERARRRHDELHLRGQDVKYGETLEAMRQRDRIDSTRKFAPLVPSMDAVILNTDGMSIEQAFEKLKKLMEGNLAG
ncbi:MAG TPA: (d)CMP kinase [Anaerolineales bacterium]|nr:(d)CMP kinase [Anaerolineales bacterium]